jgi:hypothetical protein
VVSFPEFPPFALREQRAGSGPKAFPSGAEEYPDPFPSFFCCRPSFSGVGGFLCRLVARKYQSYLYQIGIFTQGKMSSFTYCRVI